MNLILASCLAACLAYAVGKPMSPPGPYQPNYGGGGGFGGGGFGGGSGGFGGGSGGFGGGGGGFGGGHGGGFGGETVIIEEFDVPWTHGGGSGGGMLPGGGGGGSFGGNGLIGGLTGPAANSISGVLGNSLGGVLNTVLNNGVGGRVSTNPSQGGCGAQNVANVIQSLLRALQVEVIKCSGPHDCLGIGTGQCGTLAGAPSAGRVCKY